MEGWPHCHGADVRGLPRDFVVNCSKIGMPQHSLLIGCPLEMGEGQEDRNLKGNIRMEKNLR